MPCRQAAARSASWPVWTSLTVTWCQWFRLQKIVEFPQLQSIKVVDISFVVQRLIPMVLATIQTLQLRVDTVVEAPMQVVQIFPVVVQRPITMVSLTMEMPPLFSHGCLVWSCLPCLARVPCFPLLACPVLFGCVCVGGGDSGLVDSLFCSLCSSCWETKGSLHRTPCPVLLGVSSEAHTLSATCSA